MKLVIFQRFIKLKMLVFKNINKDLQYLEKTIELTMKQLNYLFSSYFITYHKYSLHLQTLENIMVKYNNLTNRYCFRSKMSIIEIRAKINYLLDKLRKLCEFCALSNIYDTIEIACDLKKNYFKNNEILNFIEPLFTPINYKIYNNKVNNDNNDLIIYNDTNSEDKYNCSNLKNKEISFNLIYNSDNLIKTIRGAKIFIPLLFNKTNITIVIDGIFLNDSLNIYRKTPLLKKKCLK